MSVEARARLGLSEVQASEREGPGAYRLVVAFWRLLARVYFRRIDVTGLENVPATGGGILVAWHPNAIVDGCLILNGFTRPIVCGARHGLLAWPIVGALMRAAGALPIYRKQDFGDADEAARREGNRRSLDALAMAVAHGRFAMLFPEGVSHDEPHPVTLRTGVARLYYRALELAPAGSPPPVIIPVGLHYDAKRLFGSNALVAFHPPVPTPPPPGTSESEQRAVVRALTDELGRVLHEVVYATESWELHHGLHRTRKILRAERAQRAGRRTTRPDMKARVLDFSRVWAGYNERKHTHPRETEALQERVFAYDADLRALGLGDHELDPDASLGSSLHLAGSVLAQVLFVFLVLPPLLTIGIVANLPAGATVFAISKWGARAEKDEASLKLILGAIAFPATWLALAWLAARGAPQLAAVYPTFPGLPALTGAVTFALSLAGAFVVVHYQRLARHALRSVRVRLTRRRRTEAILRLREERAALYDDLMRLARGHGARAP